MYRRSVIGQVQGSIANGDVDADAGLMNDRRHVRASTPELDPVDGGRVEEPVVGAALGVCRSSWMRLPAYKCKCNKALRVASAWLRGLAGMLLYVFAVVAVRVLRTRSVSGGAGGTDSLDWGTHVTTRDLRPG